MTIRTQAANVAELFRTRKQRRDSNGFQPQTAQESPQQSLKDSSMSSAVARKVSSHYTTTPHSSAHQDGSHSWEMSSTSSETTGEFCYPSHDAHPRDRVYGRNQYRRHRNGGSSGKYHRQGRKYRYGHGMDMASGDIFPRHTVPSKGKLSSFNSSDARPDVSHRTDTLVGSAPASYVPSSNPAARVNPLMIPEVIANVMDQMSRLPGGQKGLVECSRVSKLWRDCANRCVWRSARLDSVDKAERFFSQFENLENCSPEAILGGVFAEPRASTTANIDAYCTQRGLGERERQALSHLSAAAAMLVNAPGLLKLVETLSNPNTPSPLPSHYFVDDPLPKPYVSKYAVEMQSLLCHKLKELTDESVMRATGHLRNLRSLEFYICESITDKAVISLCRSNPHIRELKLPGCSNLTDESIIAVAESCPELTVLDLRACNNISDVAIKAIAANCPNLDHFNIGRISGSQLITDDSIVALARQTKVCTVGLAGCDITNMSISALASMRGNGLERISVNNCARITDTALVNLEAHCTRLCVLEIKECTLIDDMSVVRRLVARKVLVELCDLQKARLEAAMTGQTE